MKINTILILMLIIGCVQQQTTQSIKGVTLTPKNYQTEEFNDFLNKAKSAGDIISWAGNANELTLNNSAPAVLIQLSRNYKFTPVIEAQDINESTNILSFVEKYKPEYIALGIEININELKPELYNELYQLIKTTSPSTKVFTIFQLERIKGLTGLYGNVSTKTQWELISQYNSDITGFTTYPGLIYKNPEDIPRDYYTEIMNYTNKTIAFSEIGWHSGNDLPGWESSEAEQARFIQEFFNLTRELKKEFIIWSFMYDQNVTKPFNTMGLYNANGTAKQAWNEWILERP